jgi:uncharacterized protein YggT (Ycf19 family)
MIPMTPLFSLVPYPLSLILNAVGEFYVLLIVGWAILSWFNKGRGLVNDVYQILDRIVSPYINLFRRFIPAAGGIDFSPLIAIIILQILLRFLVA